MKHGPEAGFGQPVNELEEIPLPESAKVSPTYEHYYTADQMRAYAAASVTAYRATQVGEVAAAVYFCRPKVVTRWEECDAERAAAVAACGYETRILYTHPSSPAGDWCETCKANCRPSESTFIESACVFCDFNVDHGDHQCTAAAQPPGQEKAE